MSDFKESSGGFSEPASTYADFIAARFGDKHDRYAWLVDFLRNKNPKPTAKTLSLPVEICIMDVEKETLNSRRLMVTRDDSGYQLATALQDEPAASETRLIFLQYRSLESINPICIDLIGLHCELDPDFFTIHFESDFDHTGQELAHYPAHSLPSERRFLQIRTDEWTFMTTTWKMSEKKRTCKLAPECATCFVSLWFDTVISRRTCA